MSTSRPNFLVIMSDQHHAGFMGCAGNRIVRTPHLDALAAAGVRFSSAYTPSPVCVPARMSFMTGQTPSANEVWRNSDMLNSGIPTFAHGLGAAGYETVLCGRMHFVGPDQHHGFEKRLVGDTSHWHYAAPPPQNEIDLLMHNAAGQSRLSAETSGPGQSYLYPYDQQVADAAVDYLGRRDEPRPWGMVVGFNLPHCPFVVPRELYDEFFEKTDMPVLPDNYFKTLHPLMNQQGYRI